MVNSKRNAIPNFFVVGAPRCGTTALYEYLKIHSQIFMSSYKEPHYFATDLKPQTPWTKRMRKKENYLKLFSDVKEEIGIGEASVFYLYSKSAAKNIYKFNKSAKIIVCLRSPVDVMYSIYYQRLQGGQENATSFKEALKLEKERRKGKKIPRKTIVMRQTYCYKDIVSFSEQLKRYYARFGNSQIHVIIFEDFVNDLPRVYKEVLKFLEVDESFQPEFKKINAAIKVKNIGFQKVVANPPEMIKKLAGFSYPYSKYIYNLFQRLNTSKGINRPPLDKKLEKKLKKDLLSDVKKLSKLIGRDVTYWCK